MNFTPLRGSFLSSDRFSPAALYRAEAIMILSGGENVGRERKGMGSG